MNEAVSNRIVLSDLSFETRFGAIEFVYTGDTNITHDNCLSLLSTANVYEFNGLKNATTRTITKNLECDNVEDILKFAEVNDAKQLYQVNFLL